MEKFNELLLAMTDKYTELTGFSIDDASDIGIRFKVLAGELSKLHERLDSTAKQSFVMTSSGEYLEAHALCRGITRKGVIKATGTLRFSSESPATLDITIPKGIICSTVGEPSYRFITVEDGILKAGTTHIDIMAQAEEGGESFNTAPDRVTLMITPATGISTVCNKTAFVGGADEESDASLLDRIAKSYKIISNGTNSAYYYEEAIKEEEITSVNVIPKKRGVSTVDIVVTSGGVSPSSEALARISSRIAKQREINVDVRVYSATAKPLNISVEVSPALEYDFEVLHTAIKDAITSYINGLNIGENLVLARLGNFIYKTEGLFNYKFTSPITDIAPLPHEIITSGEITITRMGV